MSENTSVYYRFLLRGWLRGTTTEAQLDSAVNKGWITLDEKAEIMSHQNT